MLEVTVKVVNVTWRNAALPPRTDHSIEIAPMSNLIQNVVPIGSQKTVYQTGSRSVQPLLHSPVPLLYLTHKHTDHRTCDMLAIGRFHVMHAIRPEIIMLSIR